MPTMIKTDKKRYKQVLYNLIGNSIKFTSKGKIVIQVSFDDSRHILTTSV